jgi:hypothetical protein
VRLYEKGGKVHEMPAHHELKQYLDWSACGPRAKSVMLCCALG